MEEIHPSMSVTAVNGKWTKDSVIRSRSDKINVIK